jgi:HSP90 family molecular chaperone
MNKILENIKTLNQNQIQELYNNIGNILYGSNYSDDKLKLEIDRLDLLSENRDSSENYIDIKKYINNLIAYV